MEFLHWLAGLRFSLMDSLMLAVTELGSETAFLVIALILFWCVDKRQGYYILSTGFLGTITNQFLKLLFHVPRPWIKDPTFQPVEKALSGAEGFSFPSGHTQISVTTFGGIAYTSRRRLIRSVGILLAVLIPFSRMYLGVHTPEDVLVSAVIALALIFLIKPLVYGRDGKNLPWFLGAMLAVAVAFAVFVCVYPFDTAVQGENLTHGKESAFTLLGALVGMLAVYAVDEKWLRFSVEARWPAQILKVVLGLVLVLLVKSGLKSPLNALFGDLAGRTVRYFLTVVTAGILWPLTFRFFSRLGEGKK